MSLEIICLLKAFEYHHYPDTDAKSMVKRLIFLQKFAVLQKHKVPIAIDTSVNLERFWMGLPGSKIGLKSSKMKK